MSNHRDYFCVALFAAAVALQTIALGATAIDWRSDLEFLRAEAPKAHANLFHHLAPAAFNAGIDDLEKRSGGLSDAAIVTELGRIIASVHDAHSGLDSMPSALRSRFLPLKLYAYSDGVFIQSTDKAHAAYAGARVLAIGGTPIDEAMRRAASITSASNARTLADFAPLALSRADTLAALGVVPDPEQVSFRLQTATGERSVVFQPLPRDASGAPEQGGFWMYLGPAPGSDWVDAQRTGTRPLWLERQQEPYWFQHFVKENALYVQCNFVVNRADLAEMLAHVGMRAPAGAGAAAEKETLAEFFTRAIRYAETHRVDRFILDLRLNGGGDNTLLRPVIHAFVRSDQVNRKGHFFALIGRRTQSAAQNFVNLLELDTNVTFVGEPGGERPNMYGDPAPITLPSSKVAVALSTLYWQDMGPQDRRDATTPAILVTLSSSDYAQGRDPVLERALQ
jgi:hypothetical protein